MTFFLGLLTGIATCVAAAMIVGWWYGGYRMTHGIGWKKTPNAGTQRGRDAGATNATETRTRPSLK